MELLAPAGTLETFYSALHAGADAVYIGAPGLNARNLARDLSLAEIGAMIEYAHGRGRKVYIAANSLILEKDLPQLAETLFLLQNFRPDGVIVQDLALVHLLRSRFPQLAIHASTLMGCSSSDGAAMLAELGCSRVVLARELTLKEIAALAARVEVELEVFVHGAMCYSTSGLCLFSSFLGGKSGLRGRCVQPCRRGYSWAGRGGGRKGGKTAPSGGNYLFSMNDLAGFEAVAQLKRAGVASLKIEGRLRSVNYVGKIVEAYRGVLDAAEEEQQQAIARAAVLAEEAMGRRTSTGYFFSPQPQEAISAHHSGNMGLHMGRFTQIIKIGDRLQGALTPKYTLRQGDRLRLHIESTGERRGFTLHLLLSGDEPVQAVSAGTAVRIGLPEDPEGELQKGHVELYKVDEATAFADKGYLGDLLASSKKTLDQLRLKERGALLHLRQSLAVPKAPSGGKKQQAFTGRQRLKKKGPAAVPLELWLRTDSSKLVTSPLPFMPDMYLVDIDKRMLSQSAMIKKSLGKRSRQVVWALPPVLFDKDLGRYGKHISQLVRSGYKNFQLGHLSQIGLFAGKKVRLFGDYTLNLANSRALLEAESLGLEATQIAAELDRDAFEAALGGYAAVAAARKKRAMKTGLTVYGAPPLFTSRLGSKHFQYERTFVSPKKERFEIIKKEGLVLTVSQKPFSLLPYLEELAAMGFDYAVIDTRHMRMGPRDMQELSQRISGAKFAKLPTFNYLGKLQ